MKYFMRNRNILILIIIFLFIFSIKVMSREIYSPADSFLRKSERIELEDFVKEKDHWVVANPKHKFSFSLFDKKGNLIEKSSYLLGGQEVQHEKWNFEYEYDGKGDLIKEIVYGEVNSGDIFEARLSKTFSYDGSGKKIVESTYDMEGILESQEIFEYDSKGRISKSYFSNITNSPVTIYHYDEKGRLHLKEDVFSGQTKRKEEYVYDDQNQIQELEVYYNGTTPGSEYVYRYDEVGNSEVTSFTFEHGLKTKKDITFYNKKNRF